MSSFVYSPSTYELDDIPKLLAIIDAQKAIVQQGLDLNGVMSLAVERAMHITQATGAAIELMEAGELVYRAVAGAAENHLGLRLDPNSSLVGLAIALEEPVQSDDTELDQRVDIEACRAVGARSMLVVPLMHHRECVGALKVYSDQPNAFDESDLTSLKLIADVISASMYQASQYNADEVFYRATHDAQTGLSNRALFFDRLRSTLIVARRENSLVGVIFIDMDGLKLINDKFGHDAGDEAIKEFAHRMNDSARHADTLARLGGDEFAIIAATEEESDLVQLVDRLKARLNGGFNYKGQQLSIGASIGTAIYPHDADSAKGLVNLADKRMYVNKQKRKQGRLGLKRRLRRKPKADKG